MASSAPRTAESPTSPKGNRSGSLNARVLPRAYFLEQLRLEKRRSDRTKAQLSIVLFELRLPRDIQLERVTALLRTISSRIRETDSLGYLSDFEFGLILPETNEDGAKKLVDKLMTRAWVPTIRIQVAAYPNRLFDELSGKAETSPGESPIFLDDPAVSRGFRYGIKRTIDIVGSILGLITLSPVMLLAGILIKCESEGPVIFRQIRLGQRAKPFLSTSSVR